MMKKVAKKTTSEDSGRQPLKRKKKLDPKTTKPNEPAGPPPKKPRRDKIELKPNKAREESKPRAEP